MLYINLLIGHVHAKSTASIIDVCSPTVACPFANKDPILLLVPRSPSGAWLETDRTV